MPPNISIHGKLLSIPFLSFAEALEFQETLIRQRADERHPDTLILTEHEPILTLGRSTKLEHWEPHWPELQAKGITLHQTNRGGSVTYHGPGQIIGYPILRLKNFCPGPRIYVQKLEKVLIGTLEEWGIIGCRHESLRGVWVKHEEGHVEKIASIGVRISKGITMHGFALNINVDLQPFSLLTPCGIKNCKVTSMMKLLGQEVNSEEIRKRLATNFADIFNVEWTEQKWDSQKND